MGYIYKITNLINGKIYIGQTSRNIEVRWKEHIRDAENQRDNSPIHIAMKKYGIENFKIECIEECENEKLNEKEQYYINQYNSYNGHIGYNATLGGEINTQQLKKWLHSHPEELKENGKKRGQALAERRKQDSELNEKIEKARMDGYKKYMEENREEWLENQRNKLEKARQVLKEKYEKNPEEVINRARENGKKASKAVYQLDIKTGIKIKIFESCSAAARELGHEGGHSNISKACRKGTTAYGFKWAYVET